ncbi:ribosome-binding protein 1-like isoform X1 [Maniola jurtina]|uniref:ribosome-binding protein 1-like isoform X1 n=1 Tax=Maniola jurtina TaxID=191418 RepID=UPI001E68F479|nr:ribosome-binding protein 1-like isoform X1 [Maniola jurtina]XP_045776391.1 ribosome-binding protein 1-like isoform X1 [Maniola jurtina]
MELQALLVLCGVGVVGVAVLLLMGLFSASGTSYEEAIAQQRRATSELLALADNKNKSKKTNKKANKKLAKKEKKENPTAATGSEPESEAPAESGMEDESVPPKPHVEFSSSIVVELPTDNPPNVNVKIRKRGKDPKIRPILINKEDPSCISDPSAAATPNADVSNHFEEMHPKDELELLQSSLEKLSDKKEEKKEEIVEKKESKPSKQSKGAKATPKQSPPEPAKEDPTSEKQICNETPQEQRKVKKGEKKVVSEIVEVAEEVVPPLNAPQPSELTTDKLLQQVRTPAPAPSPPAKSKKKKTDQDMLALMGGEGGGVAVSELVRVVRQATLSRDEIQILTDALLNKHHDPLPAHSEWTEGPNDPMQKLKKQLADKEKALADELEASKAVKAKVQELRASLNAERAGAAAARAELHTQQTRLQRLLEEHHVLVQEKNSLLGQISETEAQVSRMQNMELLIQRFTETEVALRAELSARALEAGQAREDAMLAHQHAADLAQQLQEANLAFADVEQQRQFAVHAEQLAQQELRQVQARLAGMTELQNDLQRLTARAQAAESNADKLKEDMEKQKEELTKEIRSLQEQLALRESELAELKQLKAAPAQNGLPPTSVNEEQKAAELAKVESTVEALRSELVSAQESMAEQKRQVASLQDQLAQYRDKNNELRTKNWKVVEALQSAEKALATRAAPAMPARDALAEAVGKAQEQHFAEVANVLRAVCPTAAPNSSAGKEWLQAFADNLKKELLKKETEKQQVEKDLASKLSEKENERKQLEIEMQKKLQEKELAAKEIEKKLQQQIQDKELASRKIESELLKKLQDELAAKKQSESELQKKLQDELSMKKKLESELQKKEVTKIEVQQPVMDDSRVKDLEVKNVQLQGQVDKYKRIIDDTETVLSRLQQNVSREEARWQQQLSDKQRDLEALRQHTVQQMQNKIDSLQAELVKLQTRNHSHSFADAERIAEENLMAGCAATHDTEIHNGPLQEQIKLSEI